MKKYLIAIMILMCSLSCISQRKDIIAKSTIKLEGENTNISELISINGFYYYPDFEKNDNIIFFEDGTFIKFSSKGQVDKNQNVAKLSDYAYYIEDKGQMELIGEKGVYTVKQDTIVVYIYPPSLLVGWTFDEERYKVIDRETIKKIYEKGLLKADEEYYKNTGRSPWVDDSPMKFIPITDSLPSSDNWLKEKKMDLA